MNTATESEISKLAAIVNTIVDCVRECPQGAPAGLLYSSLMQFGCTLDQFNILMNLAVQAGKLKKKGHLYFAA